MAMPSPSHPWIPACAGITMALRRPHKRDENGLEPGGTTRAVVIGAASPCRNLPGWLTGI